MHINIFFLTFQDNFTFFILVCANSQQTDIGMLCEFNSPTWWARRQLIGSLRCNRLLLRFWCNQYDRPRICRSHLDRPPKLRWVRSSLDSGCCMCSSYIRPARVGTNCKSIYSMRHCLDYRLSWFLDALFSPFPFPSYYPFWRWRFPLPNEHLVWRTVHCHR